MKICNNQRTVCIIQARLGSTRLPGKVLDNINGKIMLDRVLDRVRRAKTIDTIVIASDNSTIVHKMTDKQLKDIKYFSDTKIPNNDVLSRYYHAAMAHHADIIVRVTSDCPLIMPELIDYAVAIRHINNETYVGVEGVEGIFGEVFTMKSLEEAFKCADNNYEREHVTPYIKRTHIPKYVGNYKLSVDTPNDIDFVSKIIKLIENKDYA